MTVENIQRQQNAAAAKKLELEGLCKASRSSEEEKQRTANLKLAAQQKDVDALKGDITKSGQKLLCCLCFQLILFYRFYVCCSSTSCV